MFSEQGFIIDVGSYMHWLPDTEDFCNTQPSDESFTLSKCLITLATSISVFKISVLSLLLSVWLARILNSTKESCFVPV